MARYIDIILRRRWLVVAFTSLLMLLATIGAGYLTAADDFRIMLGKDNPQLSNLEALENTFSASNTALIAIAPKEGSVFTRETLRAIEELTETAWKAPHSSRVDSLTNYNHSRAEGDELIVKPLVDDARSLSDADLASIRKIALSSTDLAGRLVSRDARVAGVAITFIKPQTKGNMVTEVANYLDTMLAKARTRHPGIAYYMTGDVVYNHVAAVAMKDGLRITTPIVFCVVILGTALLLRTLLGTLIIIVITVFSMNTALGVAGWLGVALSPIEAAVPIIIIVIAVAHSIHIISTTLSYMRRGLDRSAAVAESLRANAWPVFLTSITTGIGFLSLNASDSLPIRETGNLAAFGVLCIFSYSMTLLPALLSILPLRARRTLEGQSLFFERFGEFIVKRRTPLLWFTVILTLILLTGIPKNEMSDKWTAQFDERYQFRRDTDFINKNLTGLNAMEYSLKSGREGGIADPEYLKRVDTFAEWARKQPEVNHVRSFADIMKRLNRNMNGDDPTFYRLPNDSKLAAQYLLLYEFSIPFGGDLNDRIDAAKSTTRMTLTLIDLSARSMREFDARVQNWLRANIPDFATEASGLTMVYAHLTLRNMKNMLRGTFIGMLIISLILIWVFKSWRLGLISLVPNFIPPAMGFGLWGFAVGRISLTTSVTTAIAFGIIVDDTIHFMSKYLQARRDGLSAPDAVRSTFSAVGHALWTTSVVLSVGFALFATSGYEGIWMLGLMVTLMLSLGLLTDFFFLPTLLMRFDRRKP